MTRPPVGSMSCRDMESAGGPDSPGFSGNCRPAASLLQSGMAKPEEKLSEGEVKAARRRRLEMQHLQQIEGNPLDAGQVAIFEMFEREQWSHERCRAYLLELAREAARSQK